MVLGDNMAWRMLSEQGLFAFNQISEIEMGKVSGGPWYE